ncbi:MAG: BatA and WFA domain-containing protein, partial [Sedimentisphaerales bacterium]|nr:BatA and WFA domain-containing protein [Sedimentisphaerales bacterium]
MIFPAASFLYLLPLAGLPVLFHFLLRQKSRKLVFSTLMFFNRTHPRLNSRRKLRQWLILLMRVLFIVFVLLALSRPVIRTGSGAGGRAPVVIVMDNSGSMSGMFNKEQTKLQCGLEAARKIIFSLKDKTEAAVVLTVDDPAAKTTNSLTRDKKALLEVLERIRPTHATGQADEALRQAFSLLSSDPARGGIVQVFSDLQYDEWGKGAKRPAAGTAAEISVFLHKIESPRRDEANVAITAVRMPLERILPRHPYNIGVVLQNTSERQGEIRVNCLGHIGRFAGNQGYANTKKVILSRQMSKTVSLIVKPEEPGFQGLQVRIEGDGFIADNEVGIGIICREKATVLFQGSERQFGVLPVALSPTGRGDLTGIITEFCNPDQLKKEAAEKKPILIVTTWNELSQSGVNNKGANNKTEWLREYVEKGGNLLIVPARGPQQFPGKLPDWLGAGLRQRVIERQGRKLIVLDKRTDFWRQIRSKTGTIPLDSVHVFAYYPLEPDSGYTPLLGVDFT